jgi:hypothetical protein
MRGGVVLCGPSFRGPDLPAGIMLEPTGPGADGPPRDGASPQMRILHFIPQFPYFGGRTVIGGHASCLLSLSLAQAAPGHEVTTISCVHGRGRCEINIDEHLTVHGLIEDARPGRVTHGLRLRAAAAAWLRQKRGRFDVVHGHSGFADYLMVSAPHALLPHPDCRRTVAVARRPRPDQSLGPVDGSPDGHERERRLVDAGLRHERCAGRHPAGGPPGSAQDPAFKPAAAPLPVR